MATIKIKSFNDEIKNIFLTFLIFSKSENKS